MLQWYLLSHRAKNKCRDCYVEWSHEYMLLLAHKHTMHSKSFLVVVNKESLDFVIHNVSRKCDDYHDL